MVDRCAATGTTGRQCRNRAMSGGDYCRVHGVAEDDEASVSPPAADNGSARKHRAGRNGSAAAAPPDAEPEDRGADWLRQEVERLVQRTLESLPISRVFPDFAPGGVIAAFRENLSRLTPRSRSEVLQIFRNFLTRRGEYLNRESLEGAWAMVQSFFQSGVEAWKRRGQGDYAVDEFGMDPEFLDLCRPVFKFLYQYYWRVETSGIRHVPGEGRCLLVVNHSGVLPWDGAMVGMAIAEEHPEPRYVRTLYLDWFTTLPWVSMLLTRTGQVLACPENGERLLNKDHLVAVFPEGLKGVGKAFRDRYQLARFGRGGFARMAIRCRAPIIPVSVVGAEEIHPVLHQSQLAARALGFPYFPITPTFPLLGLLGVIPLPSKWMIHFGEPIRTDGYDPKDADNFLVVSRVTKQVRDSIQVKLHELRKRRGSVFLGR